MNRLVGTSRRRALAGVPVLLVVALAGTRTSAARGLSLSEAIALAQSRRPEVSQAEADVRLAELGVLQARLQRVRLSVGSSLTEQVQRLYVNAPEELCESIAGLCELPPRARLFGLNARLEVPIWSGLAITAGSRRADLLELAARAQKRSLLQRLTLEVTEAYWAARRADLQREVAERGLRRKAELATILNARDRAGTVPAADAHRAQAAALRQRAALVELTGQVQQTRARLAAVLQVDEEPIPTDNPGERMLPLRPLEQLVGELEQRRPDLQASRARLRAQDQQVRVARGPLWPQVSLFGQMDAQNEILGVPQPRPIASFTAGLSVKWQVFDTLTTYLAVEQAEIARDRETQDHLRAGSLARTEVAVAHARLATARQRRSLLEQTLALAREAYQLVRRRYEGGAALLIELRDAEDEMDGVESAVIDNDLEIATAATELEVALGT